MFRVQKGTLKGKSISMPPESRGHSCFTPGLVKEALFQLVENRLETEPSDYAFFDLCAGSGQIAIEALSRGYHPVHAAELDQGRFEFLIRQVRAQKYDIRLHRKDFRKMSPFIEGRSVVFLDLPYTFWTPLPALITDFLGSLGDPASGDHRIIVIQGPAAWPDWETHAYGGTVLSLSEQKMV